MLYRYIRNVLFRINKNVTIFKELKRNIKFISRRNITYAIFPLVPLFDNKYENYSDCINDINDINLNKLYKEVQKCNDNDIDKLLFYEKIVDVLGNIDVRYLNEESRIIYLHLLLISTNYCSINKDLKLDKLISKLILIYSTSGKYIMASFPKNSGSKDLIVKLKQYKEWNFTNETILDSLIKFLLSIKCKLNGGNLDIFEKTLLLEMNRKRLYNLFISSFYNDIYGINKGRFEVNFVSKWIESLYYLILINIIYVYNFIKLIQSYDYISDEDTIVENDNVINNININKREARNIRTNKIKNLNEIETNQTDLNIQYYRQKERHISHSEWSYSGNSTIFQLERNRYSPTRSDYIRQLPKCRSEEPLWPE